MFYLIKFVYAWILPPACIILGLAVLDVWLYRQRAKGWKVLGVLIVLLYFFSIRVGANLLVWPLEHSYMPPKDLQGDVILMLGNGFVSGAPDVDGIGQPSGTMAKSMLTVFRLQRQTGLPVLISGGSAYSRESSEADIAAREFSSMGIPADKLFVENQSRNTVENARLSKVACEANGWGQPILAVVAAQAPRSAMIFAREGLDCVIYPTHYRREMDWHFSLVEDLVPSGGNLDDSAMALKEYMGILALKLSLQ